MVGAGCALAGAASARFIDLDRERRTEVRRSEEDRKRDLDETRRLAYVALMSKGARNYELAATIANAIEHHQQVGRIWNALLPMSLKGTVKTVAVSGFGRLRHP
jgi:hypothetical protein